MTALPSPSDFGPNLYAHPVAAALLHEALALLGDGVSAASIEEAGVTIGMSNGPLQIVDEVSLDVIDHALHRVSGGHSHDHAQAHGAGHGHDDGHAHDDAHDHDHAHAHVHDHPHGDDHGHPHTSGSEADHVSGKSTAHRASPPLPKSAVYVVEKMAHGYKRLGRAAGGGFYDHTSGAPQLWSGLKTFERRSRQLDPTDVRDRLLYAAIAAAIDSGDADVGAVRATFGPELPVDADTARSWIARIGEDAHRRRALDLTSRFGPRFGVHGATPGRSASV